MSLNLCQWSRVRHRASNSPEDYDEPSQNKTLKTHITSLKSFGLEILGDESDESGGLLLDMVDVWRHTFRRAFFPTNFI